MSKEYNYYQEQLDGVNAGASNFAPSIKIVSNGNGKDTNFMALNDESAPVIIEWLKKNFMKKKPEVKTKVRTVILSHLSDAGIEMNLESKASANDRLKFVRALTIKFPDTDTELTDREIENIWRAVVDKQEPYHSDFYK